MKSENANVDDKSGVGYASSKKELSASYVFFIFASYITSYARIHMHKLMKKDSNCIYTDTDSIWTTNKYAESKELGGLKLEYETDKAIFIRPKVYMAYSKNKKPIVKVKGLSRAMQSDFNKILKSEKVSKELFVKLKTGLKRGLAFNEIITVEKSFNLEDNKRVWKNNFNPVRQESSAPIVVSLSDEEFVKAFPSHH